MKKEDAHMLNELIAILNFCTIYRIHRKKPAKLKHLQDASKHYMLYNIKSCQYTHYTQFKFSLFLDVRKILNNNKCIHN